MKEIITKIYCDICKKESKVICVNYPVIFTTSQSDGMSCNPYLSEEKLEVCEECLNKICMLYGSGAQGINNYEIKLTRDILKFNQKT